MPLQSRRPALRLALNAPPPPAPTSDPDTNTPTSNSPKLSTPCLDSPLEASTSPTSHFAARQLPHPAPRTYPNQNVEQIGGFYTNSCLPRGMEGIEGCENRTSWTDWAYLPKVEVEVVQRVEMEGVGKEWVGRPPGGYDAAFLSPDDGLRVRCRRRGMEAAGAASGLSPGAGRIARRRGRGRGVETVLQAAEMAEVTERVEAVVVSVPEMGAEGVLVQEVAS